MALRAIRLVIPSGTTAFKPFNVIQKVRTENKGGMDVCLACQTRSLYKDMLTLASIAASIIPGHSCFGSFLLVLPVFFVICCKIGKWFLSFMGLSFLHSCKKSGESLRWLMGFLDSSALRLHSYLFMLISNGLLTRRILTKI